MFRECCSRRFRKSSNKEAATQMGESIPISTYSKNLEEFKLELNRLVDPNAHFYTVHVRDLGCLIYIHKGMTGIYEYCSGGNVPILRLGTPYHTMFIIGQYPIQAIVFERLAKGRHEYFAVSIQSQKTIIKRTVDQEIYKFGLRFARFFVSDMPLQELTRQLNEFPVKIMSPGIKTHPISIECKDIPLWRIKFTTAIDSPLANRHFLWLCLNQKEEECRLYCKPQLVNQDLYVPISFPNNNAAIKIHLPSKCDLGGMDKSLLSTLLIDKPLEDFLNHKIVDANLISSISFGFASQGDPDVYIGAQWECDLDIPDLSHKWDLDMPDLSHAEETDKAMKSLPRIGDILMEMMKYWFLRIDELAPNGILPTQLLNGFYPTHFRYPSNSDV